MSRVIAIDPGRYKCGVILADSKQGIVLEGKVVSCNSVIKLINLWKSLGNVELILIGNGTSSNYWKSEINIKTCIPIKIVEERGTTLRARDRYWELWPKNYFLRLFPKGIILPFDNLDAIAALVLMEDYLNQKLNWQEKPIFKIWPEQ